MKQVVFLSKQYKIFGCSFAKTKDFIILGDFRSNQNAPLLMLHMMLINNHNSIAKNLFLLNPHWDDERLFQETRTIMIAIFQKITYYEWFPVLLGIFKITFFIFSR